MTAVNRKTGRCRKPYRKECVCWKSRFNKGCLDCTNCGDCDKYSNGKPLLECPFVVEDCDL